MSDVKESPPVVDLTSTPGPLPVLPHGDRTPSFPELVYAHFVWFKELRRPTGSDEVHKLYHKVLDRFERAEGTVLDAYWCAHIESAVALTQKTRKRPWLKREIGFHRATDWATRRYPDIAAELHRCDELAIRAKTVLTGIRQRICLQLVMTSAAHLLSLVDARAADADEKEISATLAQERELISKTAAYYREAANGQAQMVYFVGMTIVAAVMAIASGAYLTDHWAGPISGAVGGSIGAVAGSIGAVVSVVQRINAGHFDLSFDVGRRYAFFLGGLRPLIGAAFAVAISFAFTSGILHLPLAADASPTEQRLALIVIAFLSGFSERWAQDTLATALPTTQPAPSEPAQAPAETTTSAVAASSGSPPA